MRTRFCVAEQHHVVPDPALAADHGEIAPHRAVGKQLVTIEEPAEDLGHSRGGLGLVQSLQAGSLERLRIGFEDPGRTTGFILIGVGDERPPLGLLENEGEGVERLGRAHPGEHVGANVDLRLEVIDVFFAEAAVDAIGQQNQIGVGEAGLVVDIDFETQVDAELVRPLLEDQEQLASRTAAEAVAAHPVHRAAEMHGDVVPVGEFLSDAAIARKIMLLEIVERGIREHHPEAKGVAGAIALIYGDVGARALLLEEDCSVETRRSATDDRDFHGSLANLSGNEIILTLK